MRASKDGLAPLCGTVLVLIGCQGSLSTDSMASVAEDSRTGGDAAVERYEGGPPEPPDAPEAPGSPNAAAEPPAPGALPNVGPPGAPTTTPPEETAPPADATPPPPEVCATRNISVPVRRLTADEYHAVLGELFGQNAPDVHALLPETGLAGTYSTDAESHRVGAQAASSLIDAAEEVAFKLLDVLPRCTQDFESCAAETISEWADVALRQQGSRETVQRLTELAQASQADGLAGNEALAVALTALLLEPRFLYVIESQATEIWQLSAVEKAQRLGLLLLGNPADPALMQAAANGELDTASSMGNVIQQQMQDPRLQESFQQFIREWLGLRHMPQVHSAAVQSDLETELALLVEEAFNAPDGVQTLLNSSAAYVNTTLQDFYGVDAGSAGPEDFQRTELDGVRHGILTHPLVLAGASHGQDSSPILRGKLVRTRLLCTELPAPPAGATAQEPDLPADATAQERYEARVAVPSCGGCHLLMDPIGFGLEHYDGLGRIRSTVDGRAIDSSGELAGAGDISGNFSGAAELSSRLSNSTLVTRCLVQQWAQYGLGRPYDTSLECLVNDVTNGFTTSSRSLPALLEQLAIHPSFTARSSQ